MEKLTLRIKTGFLLLLCTLLLFGGCSQRRSLPDYRDTAFCAEVVYSAPHTKIFAQAEVGTPRTEEALPRDVTLTVSFPEALRGLRIERKDGEISLNYEGLLTESDGTGLLRCVDLLLANGPLRIGEQCQREGVTLIRAEIQNDKEQKNYELYLTPHTGVPQEMVLSDERIQIKNFQAISE